MSYSLEATVEASRLEEQVEQTNYSIRDELRGFDFAADEAILDAGCGTGVLSRYLVEARGVRSVDAVDFSELRLRQGQELLDPKLRSAIRFRQQDLARLDREFHGRFDTVICRYVIEHSSAPSTILSELKKALKPGGRLIIVELDGVFVNLHSEHPKLAAYMRELSGKLQFDLCIGRKVPALLKGAGLSDIRWSASLLTCQGESLKEEYENTRKRFIAMKAFLSEVFGTEERSQEFQRIYLEEMLQEQNTLVFTKYICTGYNRGLSLVSGRK